MECIYCGKNFEKGTSLGGHIPRCLKNPSFIEKRLKRIEKKNSVEKKITKNEYLCECGKLFQTYQKLGGHKTKCEKNPNREKNINKISISIKDKKLSDSCKEKISEKIKIKINKGEWHTSFSRSRTHEYKGVKLHGKWELEYAKWMDFNNLKWIRPIESFEYIFENIKRKYTPDFYMTDTNQYIEIKGYPTEKDFSKWKYFPFELKIITGKDLYSMGLIDNYKSLNITYKDKNW
jgi:hypothetical protein